MNYTLKPICRNRSGADLDGVETVQAINSLSRISGVPPLGIRAMAVADSCGYFGGKLLDLELWSANSLGRTPGQNDAIPGLAWATLAAQGGEGFIRSFQLLHGVVEGAVLVHAGIRRTALLTPTASRTNRRGERVVVHRARNLKCQTGISSRLSPPNRVGT